MPFLAGEAVDHIEITLGALPADPLEPLKIVNTAGRLAWGIHRWAFLRRRAAPLALPIGARRLRLPNDLGRVISIEGSGSLVRRVKLVDFGQIHKARQWAATPITGFHLGAITHSAPDPPNLLVWSDRLAEAPWGMEGGLGAVAPDLAESPFTGETTAVVVTDDNASAVCALQQPIHSRLLSTGEYACEVVMRPNPLMAGRPKSAIALQSYLPASDGRQALVEITWNANPWSGPPTVYIDPDNTGLALASEPRAVGKNYWAFQIKGFHHDVGVNGGDLYLRIIPALAGFAEADGVEDVNQTGAIDVARALVTPGRFVGEYAANGEEVYFPRVVRPFLEIHPDPASDEEQPLTIEYQSKWNDMELDTDEIPLPEDNPIMQTLFLEALRVVARGWDEEDDGNVTDRAEMLLRSSLLRQAKINDGLSIPNLGPRRGGIGQYQRGLSGLATQVNSPRPRS